MDSEDQAEIDAMIGSHTWFVEFAKPYAPRGVLLRHRCSACNAQRIAIVVLDSGTSLTDPRASFTLVGGEMKIEFPQK